MTPTASLRVTVLRTAVFLGLSAAVSEAQGPPVITVDSGAARISIASAGTPRAELLEILRTKFGIEVRPYLEPEGRVTVRLEKLPYDSAIAAIMPRGGRYAIRFGERDVTTAGDRPAAAKRGPKERRAVGLTPKRESRIVKVNGPRFKPEPERVVDRPAPQGRGLKRDPATYRAVPPGTGPKAARAVPGQPDSTLHVTFTIRAPDSVRVTGARMIDGTTVVSRIVRGPFVFVVRGANGAVLHYGTTVAPLEEHAYENVPGNPHVYGQAREGTFNITIPAAVVRQLAGARLEFYDASGASLPRTLEPDALERVLARSKRAGRVDGRALTAAFREGPR